MHPGHLGQYGGLLSNSFTADIHYSVDQRIPEILSGLFEVIVLIIVRFLAILYIAPPFGLFGILVTAASLALTNFYIKAQLSVKREQDKAKAPVMGHFQSTVQGIGEIPSKRS
jgi:ABC-type multidrug transport system fused ATPase/permease subunit